MMPVFSSRNDLIARLQQACPELSSITNLPTVFNDNSLIDSILHYVKQTCEAQVKSKDISLFNELSTMQPMSPYTAKNFIDTSKNIINSLLQTVQSSPNSNELIKSLNSLYTVAEHFAREYTDFYTPDLLQLKQQIVLAERQNYTSNLQFQPPQAAPQASSQSWVKHSPRFDDGKNEMKIDHSPVPQTGKNLLNNSIPQAHPMDNNNNSNSHQYGLTPSFQMPPQTVPQGVGLSSSISNFANPPISPPQQQQQPLQPPPQQQQYNSNFQNYSPQLPPQPPLFQQQQQPFQQQQPLNSSYQNYPPQQQQYYQQPQPIQQSIYGIPRANPSPVLPQKKVYPEYTAEMHYNENPPNYAPEELIKSQQAPPMQSVPNPVATEQLYKGIELIEQGRIDEGVNVLQQIYEYLEDKHKQLVLQVINKHRK